MWRLKNMLLNNYLVNKEIKEESKKYLKTHRNENMTHQNLAIAKVAQRKKYRKELEINVLSPQVRKRTAS